MCELPRLWGEKVFLGRLHTGCFWKSSQTSPRPPAAAGTPLDLLHLLGIHATGQLDFHAHFAFSRPAPRPFENRPASVSSLLAGEVGSSIFYRREGLVVNPLPGAGPPPTGRMAPALPEEGRQGFPGQEGPGGLFW